MPNYYVYQGPNGVPRVVEVGGNGPEGAGLDSDNSRSQNMMSSGYSASTTLIDSDIARSPPFLSHDVVGPYYYQPPGFMMESEGSIITNPYAPSVPEGDSLISNEIIIMPLSDLAGAVIGVEAGAYLQNIIDNPPAHEPLLTALGGDPIALRMHLESELDLWKENGIKPVFVFDGQSVVGKEDMTLRNAKAALEKTQMAWDLYADNHPGEAVKAFGAAGAIRAQDLYHILKEVLSEKDLDFIVAPFSACAQLAYLENIPEPYIDGIMGSQELLLYEISDAVIHPPTADDWKEKTFKGCAKSDLIRKLGVTPEMFADCLLMVGTSFLPPFPPLMDETIISSQPHNIVDAVNLLRTSEKSINATCAAFNDILQVRDPKWLDKFRKAKMGVKHCVIVATGGVITIRNYDTLTGDHVEYLGLQLPPELYHYLSKALVGPRLLNSFSSLESLVFPTLDGVVSDEYRRLVTRSLVPLKEITAALIASRIHRGFQFKDITMRFWFDENLKQTLIHRSLQPQTNQKADAWAVKDLELDVAAKIIGQTPGKLSFALRSLQEKEFPAKTISTGKPSGINSNAEVLSNVLWRLLHLRGYINDQHELTSWGRALATTLQALQPVVQKYKDIHHTEEAAFLAFELIQFDNLNSRSRHTELIGGPLRGTDDDKANCILVGRAACLLKLRHKNIGYTGPLSKNLLSYYSLIKAIRETDRDLLEAVTASMFLNGQASRSRKEFAELASSLPFGTDINITLGIAVKTYLDDHLKLDTTPAQREEAKKDYGQKCLPHSINFSEDLDVAFDFFEALYEGVKTLGDEIGEADKKSWENAKAYLAKRR